MKNAKINDYNAVCALLEELDRCYISINYEDKVRIKEAIAWLDSLPDPEPLDPYTCELMPCDECKVIGDTSQGIFKIGEKVVIYVCGGQELTEMGFVIGSYVRAYNQKRNVTILRSELKLEKRNGATIKEVGNE